jgi:histidine triad (HIT) family protein
MTPKPCVFCAIVRGEAPGWIVARGETFAAFLDVTPLFHGHVLLVPARHVETLGELEPEEVGPLFLEARRLARAVEHALGAGGTFVAMNNRVSQSVPHLHVHVVPRTKGDGLKGFFWPRKKYGSDEERESVRAKIAAALDLEGC